MVVFVVVLTALGLLEAGLRTPLPYPAESRLVTVRQVDLATGRRFSQIAGTTVQACLEHPGIEALGYVGAVEHVWAGPKGRRVWNGARLNVGGWALLRPPTQIGEGFLASDFDREATPAVILGDATWTQYFGRDPTIVGKLIELDDKTVRVAGVLTTGFPLPFEDGTIVPDFVEPWALRDADATRSGAFGVIARLTPASSRARIEADLDALQGPLSGKAVRPDVDELRVRLLSIGRDVRHVGAPYLILAGAGTALLMLHALVTLVGLQRLEHAVDVQKMRIRLALGASPSQVRFAYAALTSAFVCAAAAVAVPLSAVLSASLAGGIGTALRLPPIDVSISRLVLLSIFMTIVAASISIAAIRLPDAHRVARGLSGGRPTAALRRTVAACYAITGFMLVPSSYLAGAFAGVHANHLAVLSGLPASNVAVLDAGFSPKRYSPEQTADAWRRVTSTLTQSGCFTNVALVYALPFSRVPPWASLTDAPSSTSNAPGIFPVSASFFNLFRIAPIAGRTFSLEEQNVGAAVVVATATAARHFWPGQTPLGKTIVSPWFPAPFTVVGVVPDFDRSIDGTPRASFLMPIPHRHYVTVSVAANVAAECRHRALEDLPAAVLSVDGGARVGPARWFGEVTAGRFARDRVLALIFGGLTVAGLLISVVCAAGLSTFGVAVRSRELALRVALGASSLQVMRLLTVEILRPGFVGVILGIGATVWLAKVMERVPSLQMRPLALGGAIGLWCLEAAVILGATLWLAHRNEARLNYRNILE
jgi:hypothetical protein